MNPRLLTVLPLAACAAISAAHAAPGDRLKAWMASRHATAPTDTATKAEAANAPGIAPAKPISYGTDPKQIYEFWPAQHAADARPPLLVFVHGGAWSMGDMKSGTGTWKPAHFPEEGYALASLDYRLVPQAQVEDEAADIAHALKSLIDQAGTLGFDPARVVLMGHSAGAHLVALVGTDERYLKTAGLGFGNLRGVIALDGAGYDVPEQMAASNPRFLQNRYEQAFGSDPARQRALSPTFQAAAPNAPRFLLLHVQRTDGIAQAKELETALKSAGTPVQRQEFPGNGLQGHTEINREMGNPAYPATPVVDAWLKDAFLR